MRLKMSIILSVALLELCFAPPTMAGDYDCWLCYPYNLYWLCMLSSSGGFTCATPSSNVCVLTGICPPGGIGCFLSGTMVDTENGPRAIEKLSEGESVLSLDGTCGIRSSKIIRTHKSIQCSYYLINGTIRVSGTHPFWTNGEWVQAAELRVGDKLKGMHSEAIPVTSIEIVHKAIRAYNIEVADAHTFFVEGALVHNKGPDPVVH